MESATNKFETRQEKACVCSGCTLHNCLLYLSILVQGHCKMVQRQGETMYQSHVWLIHQFNGVARGRVFGCRNSPRNLCMQKYDSDIIYASGIVSLSFFYVFIFPVAYKTPRNIFLAVPLRWLFDETESVASSIQQLLRTWQGWQ